MPLSLMQALNALLTRATSRRPSPNSLAIALRDQLADGQASLEPRNSPELLGQLIEVPASRMTRNVSWKLCCCQPWRHRPCQAGGLCQIRRSPKRTRPSRKAAKAGNPAKPANTDASTQPSGRMSCRPSSKSTTPLYGVVRMAQPSFLPDGTLQLAFCLRFSPKTHKENANRQKLADIIHELTGQTVAVECLLDKTPSPPKVPAGTAAKIARV